MSIKINSPQIGNELAGKTPEMFNTRNEGARRSFVGPSLASITANSAEELTFQFSALREQSHKELDSKLVSGANWARVVRVEKIRELFEQITGEKPDALSQRAKKLLQKINGSKDAYDAVAEMESDPTMQYMILREAAHLSSTDLIAREKVDVAIQVVEEQGFGKGFLASKAIKSDMNSAPAIADAVSGDKRMGDLLRETYRNLVCGCESVAEMALHLLEQYPESEMLKAMKTLARALGDDLRSKFTSSQPEKLDATLKDLQAINTINSTLAACGKSLSAVKAKGGTVKRSGARVATDLIRLAHLSPAERFVTDVLLAHVDGEKKVKLSYLASCAQIFNHSLPARIWPDEDSKENWLTCISDYLNREDPRDLKAV